MRRQNRLSLLVVLAAAGLSACGGARDATETVTAAEKGDVRDSAASQMPETPGTMFEVNYRIIGTPIVGSPVSIDLEIVSAFGTEPVNISYQVPDRTALLLDESQPDTLTRTPLAWLTTTGQGLSRAVFVVRHASAVVSRRREICPRWTTPTRP